jgi:hypothetical protein
VEIGKTAVLNVTLEEESCTKNGWFFIYILTSQNFILDNPKQSIYVRGHGTLKIAMLGADETAQRVLQKFADQACTKNGSLTQLSSATRHRIQVSF